MGNASLVWFRRDLRILDHEALRAACANGKFVTALYVDEIEYSARRRLGGASRWWLYHSLKALRTSLADLNIKLVLKRGDPTVLIANTATEIGARNVYCSAVDEPAEIELTQQVTQSLQRDGCTLKIFSSSLLRPPSSIRNKQGNGYKVFTPYWNIWRTFSPPAPLPQPVPVAVSKTNCVSEDLDTWGLLPTNPDWASGLRQNWQPGSLGACKMLEIFVQNILGRYQVARDFPGLTGTTRLSAHLHFGEITARQIWHAAQKAAASQNDVKFENDAWSIIRQLCWRDFNHDLLARFPNMNERNINTQFDAFPWQSDPIALAQWQNGETGYPIVDAGMRELWSTGWMHNRVRMIVASFLVKHLLIHWRAGENWFWDTLVDADFANNAANWQWVAGSGADAAPYFRIFNPILQGEKFDPNGDYVRKWVPERAQLPNKLIHKPNAKQAGLLQENYPAAMIEHGFARKRALEAFASLKK